MQEDHKCRRELVEPFEIDDGELEGLKPAQCFTLGVEWQMIRSEMWIGLPFSATIHRENRGRILRLLERRRWVVESTPMGDGFLSISAVPEGLPE